MLVWVLKNVNCKGCKKNDVKHYSRLLCRNCYLKDLRKAKKSVKQK